MTEGAGPMQDFPLEDLFVFMQDLRRDHGYGIDEFIAVQEILLGLAERGELPTDLYRLEGYLRPILCRNRREQLDFAVRYQSWVRGRLERGSGPDFQIDVAPEAPSSDSWKHQQGRLNRFTLVVAIVGVICAAWALGQGLEGASRDNTHHSPAAPSVVVSTKPGTGPSRPPPRPVPSVSISGKPVIIS